MTRNDKKLGLAKILWHLLIFRPDDKIIVNLHGLFLMTEFKAF
jgi:hypothetical protein